MKSCYEPQADYRGRETKKGLLNVNEPIESAAKAAKGVQPRIGSLDGPTSLSQTAALFGVALGNEAATEVEYAPKGRRLREVS